MLLGGIVIVALAQEYNRQHQCPSRLPDATSMLLVNYQL